jgi:hypothetical protein
MSNYQARNDVVEGIAQGISEGLSNNNMPGKIFDNVFLGGKNAKKAQFFMIRVMTAFSEVKFDTKRYLTESGIIKPDENGMYSERDAEIYATMVTNTMLFYSDQSELGSYEDSVKIPKMSKGEALLYLNYKLPSPPLLNVLPLPKPKED